MVTRCIHCHKAWSGYKPEHCPACHKTFGGTVAGDRHRVGQGSERRCLTDRECREAGLTPRMDRNTGHEIWGRQIPGVSARGWEAKRS